MTARVLPKLPHLALACPDTLFAYLVHSPACQGFDNAHQAVQSVQTVRFFRRFEEEFIPRPVEGTQGGFRQLDRMGVRLSNQSIELFFVEGGERMRNRVGSPDFEVSYGARVCFGEARQRCSMGGWLEVVRDHVIGHRSGEQMYLGTFGSWMSATAPTLA